MLSLGHGIIFALFSHLFLIQCAFMCIFYSFYFAWITFDWDKPQFIADLVLFCVVSLCLDQIQTDNSNVEAMRQSQRECRLIIFSLIYQPPYLSIIINLAALGYLCFHFNS